MIYTLFQLFIAMSLQNTTTSDHPFSPCPGTPNCVIETHTYNSDPETLFHAALFVLNESNTHQLHSDPDKLSIDAVYRIWFFGFKDDLKVAVQKESNSRSQLHIKSSSRVGRGDLGVNQRRINRIIRKLNKKLS